MRSDGMSATLKADVGYTLPNAATLTYTDKNGQKKTMKLVLNSSLSTVSPTQY